MKKVLMLIGLVVLAACSQQQTFDLEVQATNYWKKLGGAVDVVTKNNVANAKLLIDRNGKPVVVWAEDNGLWYLQAKRWSGTAWEKIAFPTRPLAYDSNGVTPFNVVFDSSNVLVITQPGKILRATTAWVQLGSEGTSELQADHYGRIHALFYSPANDNSFIKRWNGAAWQTVATFRERITDGSESYYVLANSFLVKTNGKPVIRSVYRPRIRVVVDRIFDWNGQGWTQVAGAGGPSGSGFADYALTSSDKVVAISDAYSGFPIITGATTEPLSLGYIGFYSLALKNNLPVVMYQGLRDNPDINKILVDAWTGSKFTRLGGNLRRDTTKVFLSGDVVVDKNGTVFALSQEAACLESATCGGANIYVSQYVP